MFYTKALLLPLLAMVPSISALGINCRGSGLCHLASWENKAPESVAQILRDAIWQSPKGNDTVYHSGDHIICASGNLPISVTPSASASEEDPEGPSAEQSISFTLSGAIHTGGVCVFPQLPSQTPQIDLGTIRSLADKLLEHGCGTCGSVPIHFVDQGSNDPGDGILTFNYVSNPVCTGECMGADGNASDPNQLPKPSSAKFRY